MVALYGSACVSCLPAVTTLGAKEEVQGEEVLKVIACDPGKDSSVSEGKHVGGHSLEIVLIDEV